jgi:glycerophosphoryl diester phosphodiesterase
MARTAYFDPPLPRVLAHRGLSQHRSDIDENSLEAFLEAIAHGATHIESDVHATKDGVAVLFHDDDLKRVANLDVKISSLSFAELSSIKLLNGTSVPSLAQALELNVRLNLDIKSASAIGPTVAEIERFQAHDRVLVSSFSSLRRRAALSQISRPVATSASMREVILAWASHRLGGLGFSRIVRDLDAFQVPPSQGPIKFATQGFIRRAKKHGVEVHFWTVNEPGQMRKLLELGADGIVSDRVDRFS